MKLSYAQPWIETFLANRFDLLDPKQIDIDIVDIAHSLANICRYTGHTNCFYSVAEHSVRVAWLLPPKLTFEGLMHDAAEAYVGDVSKPLKTLIAAVYVPISQRIDRVIKQKYGLPVVETPEVKAADLRLFATERRDLFPSILEPLSTDNTVDVEPLNGRITPWPPQEAERIFLNLFGDLYL